MWQKATILETAWHNEPLAVWKNAGNYFKIRLEAKKEITPEIKEKIESNIQKILKNWFPNCFWKHRFWKWYRNFYRAKEIFVLIKFYLVLFCKWKSVVLWFNFCLLIRLFPILSFPISSHSRDAGLRPLCLFLFFENEQKKHLIFHLV